MEIVEGDISRLEPIDPTEAEIQEDSKLYIAEFKNRMLVEKNEVFGNNKDSIIVGDNMDEDHIEEAEAVEHIIIDGHVCEYCFTV